MDWNALLFRFGYIGLAWLSLSHATPAFAGWGSYLSSYRATAEWKTGAASSVLRYDTAKLSPMPDNCIDHTTNSSLMVCSTQVGNDSKASYAFGVQQAFKRQGDLYFNADFGGSFFLLDAKAEEKDEKVEVLQPLQHVRAHLYGLNVRAYIEFGLTPAKIWPDILISLGVGEHVSTGNIKIDDTREKISIATGMTYAQLEAVWWRFKDGSLSSYVSVESGGSHSLKGDFGSYQNLKIEPSITSFGVLKLVLPYKTQ